MTKKASQTIKYKKAPGAPKRFKSAYMYFSEHQHKVIRENAVNKKIRAADVAKLVSQAWKDLSDQGRFKWLELGRIDRERYEREKAAYTGPWKVPALKDVKTKPKRPMSAFLAFSNERRAAIVEAHPHLKSKDVSSLLSEMWKQCPEEVKKHYREKEAEKRAAWKIRSATMPTSNVALIEDSSSSSSVVKSDESLSDKDALDIADFDDLMAWTDEAYENEQSTFLSALETICPLDVTRKDHETNNTNPLLAINSTMCYYNGSSSNDSNANIIMSQSITLPRREDRFENFSLDDILKSDELFEDFSPSQIKNPPISTRRSETHCQFPTVGSMSGFFSV